MNGQFMTRWTRVVKVRVDQQIERGKTSEVRNFTHLVALPTEVNTSVGIGDG